MLKNKKNKKLHRTAGGFAALIVLLLSITTFSQWDYGGVLWVAVIAIIYNALFLCFKLTNISEQKKNQIILAGNFLIANLFLIYTKGFENNAYLLVFIFTIIAVTVLYGSKRGLAALPACMLLSLPKAIGSMVNWNFMLMHLSLYMGAFFIGRAIHYQWYKTRKADRKARQKNIIEREEDKIFIAHAGTGMSTAGKNSPMDHQPQGGVTLDGLTGLLSYNAFYRKLSKMAQKALETNEKFFLLIIDIDRFKLINQHYGYAVGDKILAEIGNVIRDFVEAGGIAGRHGGEEFVAVLHDVDYEKAGTLADQLRMQIKSVPKRIDALDNQKVEISVSIGMACYPEASNDIHNLVSIAEIKMHKGKGLGGDRVTA